MMEQREIAAQVFAVRERLAAALGDSAVGGQPVLNADRIDQALQLPRGTGKAVLLQYVHVGLAHAAGALRNLWQRFRRRMDEGENEVFERLYPVLRRDRHASAPAFEIGTLADEERRTAALVFTHRLSETSE